MSSHARGSAPTPATVLLIVSVLATFALSGFHLWLVATGPSGDPSIALLGPAMLAYATLGWTILGHRPGHRIGWLLLVTVPVVEAVFIGFTIAALPDPAIPAWVGDLAAWVAVVLFGPAILLAFPALGLLFPDGRLPGRRWRWPVRAVVATAAVSSFLLAFAPGTVDAGLPDNPFALPFLPDGLRQVGAFLTVPNLLVASGLAVASMAVRVARGRGLERQQMKWVLASIAFVAICTLPTFIGSTPEVVNVAASLSLVAIPLAVATAVLRYRLYEIDRIVSRTIGWATVTGALVLVFAAGVFALQGVLTGFVAQGQTIAVAGSTLIAFALFQPMRRRVQRAVDRRFDRARYDGRQTADAFAERLRGEVAIDAVAADLEATVEVAVRPASHGLWLRTARDRSAVAGS